MAYPLAEQRQLQKKETSHSAIDDLIATDDLKQFADSDKNRLYEFLFGPQDIEYDAGFAPDLSFLPFLSKKGIMSTLKNLFGKSKSKSKFPIGYGEFTNPPKTAADDAVQVLKDLNLKGQNIPKPSLSPLYDKIAKLDKETRKLLKDEGLSMLPERKFDWSKEKWQKFSDISGISLEELTGKAIPWTEPLW